MPVLCSFLNHTGATAAEQGRNFSSSLVHLPQINNNSLSCCMATAPHPAASNTPALARSPFLLLLLCPHCGHQRFHEWCPQRVRWNGCKVYNFSSFFNFLRADFVQSPSLLAVLSISVQWLVQRLTCISISSVQLMRHCVLVLDTDFLTNWWVGPLHFISGLFLYHIAVSMLYFASYGFLNIHSISVCHVCANVYLLTTHQKSPP
jgi:hypothetical protein